MFYMNNITEECCIAYTADLLENLPSEQIQLLEGYFDLVSTAKTYEQLCMCHAKHDAARIVIDDFCKANPQYHIEDFDILINEEEAVA